MFFAFSDEADEPKKTKEKRRPLASAHLHQYRELFRSDIQKRGFLGILQRIRSHSVPDGSLEHNLLHNLWATEEVVLSSISFFQVLRLEALFISTLYKPCTWQQLFQINYANHSSFLFEFFLVTTCMTEKLASMAESVKGGNVSEGLPRSVFQLGWCLDFFKVTGHVHHSIHNDKQADAGLDDDIER
jgi:hypothetical protein